MSIKRVSLLASLLALGATIVCLAVTGRTVMASSNVDVQHLFAKTKTICAGRFLIDVPLSANVVYGDLWAPYEIQRYANDAANVDQYLLRYAAELKEHQRFASKELLKPDSMLGKVINGAVPGQRLFFGLSRGYNIFYEIYSLIPVGPDLFVQRGTPSETGLGYLETVDILNSTARRIFPLEKDNVPTHSGFCIDGAFIKDDAESDVEKIQLGVRLREFPDVHFSVEMVRKNFLVESDAIEPRLEEARRQAFAMGWGGWYSRIKILRKENRSLGPWKGFEVLTHIPPRKEIGESHDFNFVALGIPKNPLVPTIDMKLDTGVRDNRPGAVKPSVTDEQALYIWDRITNSIRIRPVK
jgi:hypothetical protein